MSNNVEGKSRRHRAGTRSRRRCRHPHSMVKDGKESCAVNFGHVLARWNPKILGVLFYGQPPNLINVSADFIFSLAALHSESLRFYF